MENFANVVKHFDAIGARLVIQQETRRVPRVFRNELQFGQRSYDLNISTRGKQEHFVLSVTPETPAMHVLQANKLIRHLLLHVEGEKGGERFLCGHDERHWFAAAVEGRVSSITDAKRALLPTAMRGLGLTPDQLARRHTDAFRRQGEWFFIPTNRIFVESLTLKIHHGEPLTRGRGKPHIAGELVRFGGQPVILWQGKEYEPEVFEKMRAVEPNKYYRAQPMIKDPEVYVRGSIRHPDHATLVLDIWHRVYPNNEARSKNLSFYD